MPLLIICKTRIQGSVLS